MLRRTLCVLSSEERSRDDVIMRSMSHSLMTDVINGKNRKRRVTLKVVLPIFTQQVSAGPGCFFCINTFHQYEQRFDAINQINLL